MKKAKTTSFIKRSRRSTGWHDSTFHSNCVSFSSSNPSPSTPFVQSTPLPFSQEIPSGHPRRFSFDSDQRINIDELWKSNNQAINSNNMKLQDPIKKCREYSNEFEPVDPDSILWRSCDNCPNWFCSSDLEKCKYC